MTAKADHAIAIRKLDRRTAIEHLAMETHAGIEALNVATKPLYEAAIGTRNFALLAETKALYESFVCAKVQARRIAGFAAGLACPDGLFDAGHGRAA